MSQATFINSGRWEWDDGSVDWEVYAADTLPVPQDCTAAFCVAIVDDQKILLEREARGWGMIGGHIDEGESVEAALHRECLEEGGFTPHEPVLFAYRKIIATKPVAHPEPGRSYPFPVSYIAYYWATTTEPIVEPTEPEVLETRTLTLDEIARLDPPEHDLPMITLGWEAYQKTMQTTDD